MFHRIRGTAAVIMVGRGKCRFCEPHWRQFSTLSGKPNAGPHFVLGRAASGRTGTCWRFVRSFYASLGTMEPCALSGAELRKPAHEKIISKLIISEAYEKEWCGR